MSTEGLVSVIVPVYNVEDYLPHCLSSISAQTYGNLEIILVDDGSTDGSGKLCDDFAAADSRVRVIHQANSGPWAARNRGHEEARGEYLFFPDADDYFHSAIVATLLEAINLGGIRHPLSICGYMKTTSGCEDTESALSPGFSVLSRDGLFTRLFARESDAPQWNKLYRASAIAGLRSREYPRAQDLDFNMRFFTGIRSAVYVDACLYYWVQHPMSLTKASDSLALHYECATRMTYLNYMDMAPGDRAAAGPYLLHFLFKRMVFYKNYSRRMGTSGEVFPVCRKYLKDTIKDYLSCGRFGLLKYFVVMLNYTPGLASLLIRASGN